MLSTLNKTSFMRRFIGIVILMTTFGCQSQDQADNKKTIESVEVNEVLTISSENVETSDSDLIFSSPYHSVTDQSGFIYTLDPSQNIIFKFDDEGNFIDTIGSEGRGPGEFQSVYAMAIVNGNQLFVYDYMSSRSTIFTSDGEIDQIINMEFRHALDQIRPASNDILLLPHLQDDHIIHTYNLMQQEITESLVRADEILKYDQKYEINLLRAMTGSAIALSENTIAYTPEYYNGTIYIYKRINGDWKLDEKLNGYQQIEKPFSIHETKSEPHERARTISVHPEGTGYLGFELHSWSLGLYSLENGKFAHISYKDADEEKENLNFVLEIFDYQSSGLQNFALIDELTTSYPPKKLPVWVDNSGFLYIIENPDNPVLRKLEVLW